jgi:hypothetical protein
LGDLDERITTEFKQALKEDKDRKDGLNQGNWFTNLFVDKETQPTERDKLLDEAYSYISTRIGEHESKDLDMFLELDPLELTLCQSVCETPALNPLLASQIEEAVQNSSGLTMHSRMQILQALMLKRQISWLKRQQEVLSRYWLLPFVGL